MGIKKEILLRLGHLSKRLDHTPQAFLKAEGTSEPPPDPYPRPLIASFCSVFLLLLHGFYLFIHPAGAETRTLPAEAMLSSL